MQLFEYSSFEIEREFGESVLGSWVGARRLDPPFLIPHRAPHGFTQYPSTDYVRHIAAPAPGAPRVLEATEARSANQTAPWSLRRAFLLLLLISGLIVRKWCPFR